jgi:hypothetical protein
MQTPKRGGAAFGTMMRARLVQLEQEQGEAISPARLTRMVFAHLVDQDRPYDQRQTQRVLDGIRHYPDAEEVHAWCEALDIRGADRARAFWLVGLLPPEVTPEELAAAMQQGGQSKRVERIRHLSEGNPARAGTPVKGRRVSANQASVQRRSGNTG